jgi:hypothetical protein
MEVLLTLKRRGELFDFLRKHYVIFSKNGFTQQVLNEGEKMQLIDFKQMTDLSYDRFWSAK